MVVVGDIILPCKEIIDIPNYRKNEISLYWGIYTGVCLCVRSKNILPKEKIHHFIGTTGNERFLFFPAIHFNAFGIDIGEKYIFNMELGIGTQGVIKAGFRYKF